MQNRKCLEYCYDSKQYTYQELMRLIEKKKSEFENRKIEVTVTLNEWGIYLVTYCFEKEKKEVLKKILKKSNQIKLLSERNAIPIIENIPQVEMKEQIVKNAKIKQEKGKKKIESVSFERIQEKNNSKIEEKKKKKLKRLKQMIKQLEKENKKKNEEKKPQDVYGTRIYGQYKPTKTYRPI